ncbi:MAG TPA: muramoyltetrapeptide carboxypeptidase [Noviherbaspirillum sp.]|nr:muramoyltetrapeptide carboxypeptidase [Noviherbaspirillum sp.]
MTSWKLREKELDGITVAIVAPSGYAPNDLDVERAIARLEAWGCRVRNFYDAAEKYQRFGGSDAARVAQLHAAAADPEVQVVLALRGGYGISRLLPALDFDVLATSGKLFVGHSDFTVLNMGLLARADAVSFSGPMVCIDFSREEPSEFTLRHFWQCLTTPSHTVQFEAQGNPAIDVSGQLWGGNLTMLTHLIGTPYLPEVEDGILFVEDVNEHPYRIERMLMQMSHAGLLRQKAIVLGDFSSYRLTEYDNGYDFDSMLEYLRQKLGVPILTGLPFGHTRDKVTLAVGCDAQLQSDGRTCSLIMSGYPHLSLGR